MKTRSASACTANPLKLNDDEIDRMLDNKIEPPTTDCSIELYFGCFFDGTRNNLYASEEKGDGSESNIARLFKAYDVAQKPKYSSRIHRFSSYIQGVGTDARPKMHDTGTGAQAQAGAAAGWGGEGRINWMLMQVQDHLHEHFHGRDSTLTKAMGREEASEVARMSADMRMLALQLQRLADSANQSLSAYLALQGDDEVALRQNQSAFSSIRKVHSVDGVLPDDGARYAILQERRNKLQERVGAFLPLKPKVKCIRLSVFGFSRGAAEARVFSNWLADACDPDAKKLTLCGIPIQFDFLGLFDTVVSAGIAQSAFEKIYSGHGAWGRSEDLSIPSYVQRCVHMVAAHEVRGSFPVDLVQGGKCEEIVYPGVHSDVGGGYAPGEQGRSPQAADKLSQIPLCDMYREALASGVPLIEDLKTAAGSELAKQFTVSDRLRQAYNSYLQAMQPLCKSLSKTYPLMQAHYEQFLLWRSERLQDFSATASVNQSSPQDRMDLLAANDELKHEVVLLEKNNATQRLQERAAMRDKVAKSSSWLTAPVMASLSQPSDSLQTLTTGPKEEQWLSRIATIWHSKKRGPDAIAHLLEHYVHDSRAWFKPLGDDHDVWNRAQLRRMQQLDQTDKRNQERKPHANSATFARFGVKADQVPILPNDQAKLDAWRRTGVLPLQKSGREPFLNWGYLRWRTVYESQAGSDTGQRQALIQNRLAAQEKVKRKAQVVNALSDRLLN